MGGWLDGLNLTRSRHAPNNDFATDIYQKWVGEKVFFETVLGRVHCFDRDGWHHDLGPEPKIGTALCF